MWPSFWLNICEWDYCKILGHRVSFVMKDKVNGFMAILEKRHKVYMWPWWQIHLWAAQRRSFLLPTKYYNNYVFPMWDDDKRLSSLNVISHFLPSPFLTLSFGYHRPWVTSRVKALWAAHLCHPPIRLFPFIFNIGLTAMAIWLPLLWVIKMIMNSITS